MNQIDTTVVNCDNAQLSLIRVLRISKKRRNCTTSKCNTVLLINVEHGKIAVGDVLRIKNPSGQTLVEKVCRLEIDKIPHEEISVPKDFKKPSKPKGVGILLEKTGFKILREFLK